MGTLGQAAQEEVKWLKKNALLIGALVLGTIVLVTYSWAEYGYFCDTVRAHGDTDCPGFWSLSHKHDYIYNLMSNFTSDLWIGIIVVTILLRAEGKEGKDKA